ncbi:MAG: hypothetical protein NVSMB26_23800 [Beijerinckiaceae bacterium]
MQHAIQRRKKRVRLGLYAPILGLLVLAIGWSVFWYVAASVTGREIGAWIKREADDGRNWTCPERSVGGYPFRIEISCKKPSFAGPAAGIPVTGGLGGIQLTAQLYNPKLVTGEVEGPFEFTSAEDGSRLSVNWKRLQISIHGGPDALERLSVVADGLDYGGNLATARPFNGHADNLQVQVRRDATTDGAYDFAVVSTGTASADLDDVTGTPVPATLQFAGTLTQAAAIGAGTIKQRVEQWRMAGGRITFASASLVKGGLSVQGSGALRLDETHRPDGRFDLKATGLEPVLQRYGLSTQLLDIGSLIGGLLGGRPAQPLAARQMQLALTFERGRLGLGPIKGLIPLPALY